MHALEEVVAAGPRATGDTAAEMRGRFHLGEMHHERGRLAEARATLFRQAAEAAARPGGPGRRTASTRGSWRR